MKGVIVVGLLEPVLKHPGHGDQKVHGRRGGAADGANGGMKVSPGNPKLGEEQNIDYDGLYVPLAIPVLDGSAVDTTRIAQYPQEVAQASEEFAHWEGNYATRTASARMMGLETTARGAGLLDGGVESFLAGKTKVDDLDIADQIQAQNRVRHAATLMDAAANGAKQPSLYRGIRLQEGDPLLSAKVGDVIEMPISAFSTGRYDAEAFTTTGRIGDQRPGEGFSRRVLIDVEPGARGQATNSMGPGLGTEVVVQGRFRVVATPAPEVSSIRDPNEPGATMQRLTLQQVGHYDVMAGEWVTYG